MATLNDLIKLAKADGGKFFVMDEQGEIKLVIMGVEDYQRMLLGKLKKQVWNVEEINRKILQAQLQETVQQAGAVVKRQVSKNTYPQAVSKPIPDMRAEVIDPSFDFEPIKNKETFEWEI